MNFYAYVPGLRLPMCISETIIFILPYRLHSFHCLFIIHSMMNMGCGHFLSLAKFPRILVKLMELIILFFSCLQVSKLLFLLLLIDSASKREKATKKITVSSFINQHGFIRLERISWKLSDVVRANKFILYAENDLTIKIL